MKAEMDLFRQAARQAVRNAGWDPRNELEILTPGAPESGSLRYGWRAGKVRLVYTPGLSAHVEHAANGVAGGLSGGATDLFQDVVAARVYLQVGAWEVCPYSAYDYAEILEASADGMRSAGATESDVQRYMVSLTSFFIAAVVCGTYAISGPDPKALRRGWAFDQLATSLAANSALPNYAAICANVQIRLWSDALAMAEALRGRFPASLDILDFETDRGVAILLDTFDHVGAADGLAWSSEALRERVLEELKYNWRDWPIKAFQWAEMLAPYVCAESGPNPAPQPAAGRQPGRGQPSDLARQRREAVRLPGPTDVRTLLQAPAPNDQPLAATPDDPFAERMRSDPAFRQCVLQSGIGRGRNPLDYYAHMGYEVLDAMYRSRTTPLEVRAETISRPSAALEIAHLAREEIRSGLVDFHRIDWAATRFGPGERMHLYRKTLPLVHETPARAHMRGFPDLLLVVDSSGSMKWDPKGGTGPYDALLRAVYSVLEFLERHGKAQQMRFAVLNFSGTTVRTPWQSYAELRKIKETLFRWQGGGTVLDCAALDALTASNSDPFLCLMVTDAQIRNASAVVQSIDRLVSRGHQFTLIQIGKETPLAVTVRGLGVPVHVVPDASWLQNLVLECGRRHFVDQEVAL